MVQLHPQQSEVSNSSAENQYFEASDQQTDISSSLPMPTASARTSRGTSFRTSGDESSSIVNRSSQTLYTTEIKPGDDELIFTKRVVHSKRITLGAEVEKPWLKSKSRKKLKIINYIVLLGFVLGLAVIGVLGYFAYADISNFKFCEVLVDDFSEFNKNVWEREVQIGGFGTGAFDWTTDSDRNSFVKNGKLYILPTLTNETIDDNDISNGYTVNLTTDGTCTGSGGAQCWIRSNSTTGAIIPPVQSARLNTKSSASIKYGKVEVRAKLPKGDWLWPAIWLLPKNNTYGPWPASGEIDIAESRGNGVHYPMGGHDVISSSLHWGPDVAQDQYLRTTSHSTQRLGMFSSTFHIYGLEWNEKYIKSYIDGRLRQVLYHGFKKPFWDFGHFSTTYQNGTVIQNPWPLNNKIAPFDQEFFLVLNVAVGGTNGFFPDSMGDKPWTNAQETTAPRSFWSAVSSWYPTWPQKEEDRALVVDYVKMYKICSTAEKNQKRDTFLKPFSWMVPFLRFKK
ncbi:putative beta-1,3-glucan-binding protein [Clavispora lusitaniae]|uniref:Beta-1,3-glucan-binding protein n=1 Tax=Clavispora lusitaniae TaxID=36911 RepID=A0ACD0WHD5_CLALS|nr:hypothetical protein E0198_001496 [Clavispora lusitaniae]QFZ26709.1 putative beta-1,3-glucan-binding protein [Clavispora lusitaniae]QFZ32377.1 putative beta-1,3-glucan-binding protein [Clavispora lusitaniae]QFZ38046.1 putative beta-1,3-glucan-binding protein [Clavispora lusitaniae]QFZ43729.1 putative beta-1,3-glucan-binding protein [Clavispora lusitaniae]